MSLSVKRLLYVVAVIALFAVSWYTLIDESSSQNKTYEGYLSIARDKAQYDMYDDALVYYNAALSMRDSVELREEVADFYYKYNHIEDYVNYCTDIMADFPRSAVGYEKTVEFYKSRNDYAGCYSVMKMASKRNVESEYLKEVYNELYYKYSVSGLACIEVRGFSSGYCAVKGETDLWGFINQGGGMAVGCRYPEVGDFNEFGYVAVKNDEGKFVIIASNGVVKYVDREGKNIEACGTYADGVMPVKYDGKYHYCDINFNKKFGDYDYASAFNKGVAAVCEGDSWYIINNKGERISKESYDDVKLDETGVAFKNDRAFVKSGDKYIMIDTTATRIGSLSWDDAHLFVSDKPAAVKSGEKWGFVQINGEMAVDYIYENARSFSNGFAAVSNGDKWGYIVADDYSVKIDYTFNEALDFTSVGTSLVKNNGVWSILRIYRMSY